MPIASSPGLADRVQQLLAARQHHADAMTSIDATLEQIRAALRGVHINETARRGPGRPRKPTGAHPGAMLARRRRGRPGTYSTTAEEMILSLVGQRGGATTQEIKAKWSAEGRGGTADNALSKMVTDKMLKRTPLAGQRGSRFAAV